MATNDFDLLIVGTGPAGCTLALMLAGKGIRIGIIEKDVFPRQKICGDALSGKVLNVMKRFPGEVYSDFLRSTGKIPSWGICFTSPNGHTIDVPFLISRDAAQPAPGYICRRNDFDHFMSGRLKSLPDVQVFQGEQVHQVVIQKEYVAAYTQSHEFRGRIIAGADGVHSVVRKDLLQDQGDKKHFCVGIRGYYENVTGLHPDNFLELLFLKNLLPGYFWIFPSTGGLVNAGLSMMQSEISTRKESLIRILNDLITSHPLIAPRFSKAKPVVKPQAHMLPLATNHLNRSGNRFILLGDAAFLVDPFTGEGIGNAMASGEIAAEILQENFRTGDFSAEALGAYDVRLRQRFSQEFRTMSTLRRLAGSSQLFNLVIDKARNNDVVRELLTAMFTNENLRKELTRPAFYAGLLFR